MKSEVLRVTFALALQTNTYILALVPGLRVPGTNYTIRSYRVETNENALLPHALKVWGRDEGTLSDYGNWCGAMYGFGHDSVAPHGPAVDKVDRLCKQWRQQTRCLFESALCDTGSEFYTLKTFDNNTFACENTLFDRCGYEKCIIDLQTVEKLKLLLDEDQNDHVKQVDNTAKKQHEMMPSIVLKSSWSGQNWVDKLYSEIFSKHVKKCCHIGLGHFTVYDEGKSTCLDISDSQFHRLCSKNDVIPSYASQSMLANSKTNSVHGAELVIDGLLNSDPNSNRNYDPKINKNSELVSAEFNTTDVQSTGYSRDRKWLIIDYSSDHTFDQVTIHTRFDRCQRCYSRLTVQLLGDKGGEGGWCKFETGKYSTPPKFTVEKGQVLKFQCSGQVGRYVRIARPSGSLTMDEVRAFSYDC